LEQLNYLILNSLESFSDNNKIPHIILDEENKESDLNNLMDNTKSFENIIGNPNYTEQLEKLFS